MSEDAVQYVVSAAPAKAPTTSPRGALGRLLLAGNVPLVALAIACGAAFMAGKASAPVRDKVAVAEQGAIVLEAMLAKPRAAAEVESDIRRPILQILEKYRSAGYMVVDVSKDEQGGMAVAALPQGSLDITAEMREAVHLPAPGLAKGAAPGPSGSSPAGSAEGGGR